MRKGVASALLGATALGLVAFGSGAAFAQDSGDIIVTARKQSETLQNVPVTIQAINAETLQRRNVTQVADLTSRVPALNVSIGGSGSGASLSIRGVGSSQISASFDSAVALAFDDVQVSTMRLLRSAFVDPAQIEVLKGPQSLYFGKSASAGVLSIRSADPTPDWEVGGRAAYEIEEEGYTVGGFVSGPITPTLGIRVAAEYNDIKKFVENVAPVAIPNRGQTNTVIRGTLQWEPYDNFKANLKIGYNKNEYDGSFAHLKIQCGDNGVADGISLGGGGVYIQPGYTCDLPKDKFFIPDGAPQLSTLAPDGLPRGVNGGVPFGEAEVWFGRLKLEASLNDRFSLTAISGYVSMDSVESDSFSMGGISNSGLVSRGVGTAIANDKLSQFTQEVRLQSQLDGPFNFMVGVFYENKRTELNTSQNGVNISLLAIPDPVTGFSHDWRKVHVTKADAFSTFGAVTWDITEQLQLSGGLRWTTESKTNTISVPYVHTLLAAGPAFIESGFFSGPIRFSDKNWSPEITARYKFSDDLNVFASFKTGFKSGGIDNSALPSSNLLGLGDNTVDPSDPEGRTKDQIVKDGITFDSETVKGGEIGIKSRWSDRAFTANATLYYYVFSDLQQQTFDSRSIQFVTRNVSELTTKGVDLELGWRTPVEGLSFSSNINYNDAKYSAELISLSGTDLNGLRPAQAPLWTGNIAADWFIPLGDSLQIGLTGNIAYRDNLVIDNERRSQTAGFQSSYFTYDATVSIGHPDGKWSLSLIGVNLSNQVWAAFGGDRPFLCTAVVTGGCPRPGDDQAHYQNRGRQVFLEARFRF